MKTTTFRALLFLWAPIASVVAQEAANTETKKPEPPPCADPSDLSRFSGTIVYEGDPIEGEDPERGFEIWVIGAPDWIPRLVAGGRGFDGHPAWSPDGSRIVYSAHGGRNADLYIVDADGGNRTRLTEAPERDDYPQWLPEGIVYKSGNERLILDPVTGERSHFESIAPDIETYTFSPDRKQMVFAKRSQLSINAYHLYLAFADGTVIRQLTDTYPREIHPAWSPVGNKIVYSGGDGRRDGKWEVFLLDLDTGDSKQLTDNPGADWACGWSPDGEWVLITSEFGGNWDIYAIRPDGTDRTRISCHKGNARYASWTSAEPLATQSTASPPR